MKNLKVSGILKRRLSLLFVIALFLCHGTYAQHKNQLWRDSLCVRIDSLLQDDVFNTSQVGICIYDLTDDITIFQHNARQTMRPASIQKLITSITALKVLGIKHRMYTTLSYMGDIVNGTLHGDIYCRGGFDPLFSNKSLLTFAEKIKELGIDTIRGTIFLDKSMKDDDELGEGWCWDDDNPTLSSLTVDGKDGFYTKFVNALYDEGVVPLTKQGIATCPGKAVKIYSTYHTFKDILHEILKESNNFYAEAMFYHLAADENKHNASARDAATLIQKLAARLGHDKSEFRVADGCGLSLYNYTTPLIETDFLRFAYNKRNIFRYIFDALPIAGVDGTLKRRMKDYANTAGNVRAKTGTVSCISSLAGYCRAYNGHDIAFCIINQGMLRTKKARIFQDRVCAILCEPLNTNINR